jgi:hypothetical protein
VINSIDECSNSNISPTVVIAGCNSGVPNYVLPTGCTIMDLLADCAGARNKGQYTKCVAQVTNDLVKWGVITGKEKGAIQSCAAKVK